MGTAHYQPAIISNSVKSENRLSTKGVRGNSDRKKLINKNKNIKNITTDVVVLTLYSD